MKETVIVITTGGSGGHIFPAEAIAGELLKKRAKVIFMTDKRGQSFQGLKGVQVYRLMAESVTGRSILGKIKAAISLYIGTVQALFYLVKIRPAAVVGVGGYASIPAVMAAHLARIPVILHEQNAVLGRANRFLARGTKLIGTSFEQTKRVPALVPQVRVGLPVREAVLKVQNTPYPEMKKSFHLLVFGGSQGARFFTQRLPEALLKLPKELRAKIELVQQVRPEDMALAEKTYQNAGFKKITLKSFFTDMPEQLKKAHLVIGRGGAGTLTELMVVGRPGLIVPLPTAADNHQEENARQFCNAGAGWLLLEKEFKAEKVAEKLKHLMQSEAELREAAEKAYCLCPQKAAEKMAEAILDIVKGQTK